MLSVVLFGINVKIGVVIMCYLCFSLGLEDFFTILGVVLAVFFIGLFLESCSVKINRQIIK